jgi:hypothetical protein
MPACQVHLAQSILLYPRYVHHHHRWAVLTFFHSGNAVLHSVIQLLN